MAIESTKSASEVNRVIRERASVVDEQKLLLKRFEGKKAVTTISQVMMHSEDSVNTSCLSGRRLYGAVSVE